MINLLQMQHTNTTTQYWHSSNADTHFIHPSIHPSITVNRTHKFESKLLRQQSFNEAQIPPAFTSTFHKC